MVGTPQEYTMDESRTKWESEVLLPPETRSSHTEWIDGQLRERISANTQIYGKKKWTRGKLGGKKKKKQRILGTGIFNLSDVSFSNDELKVLDLGLKFSPEKDADKFEVYIDLQKFMRKLNLKKHFAIKGGKIQSEFTQTTLHNNLIFNPKVPGSNRLGLLKPWWKVI